jgi:DNA-binding NarL/FixJ family response regulator
MVEPIKSGGVTSKISTPAKAPQVPFQAKAEVAKSDTVQLSNEAQARSMRQQGLSIPEIAQQLRLDVKTVTGFFPQST